MHCLKLMIYSFQIELSRTWVVLSQHVLIQAFVLEVVYTDIHTYLNLIC